MSTAVNKRTVVHDGKECFCIQFIPMEQQGAGPHHCRDCSHPESCHPEPLSSATTTSKTVDDVLKNFRPELAKLRMVTTDEDAQCETNSGFRATEAEDEQEGKRKKKRYTGRGGSTRFKVSC